MKTPSSGVEQTGDGAQLQGGSAPLAHEMRGESAEEKAARYERALQAIQRCTLTGADFGDWVRAVCHDVLAGEEAECWNCGTIAHDGECVSDGSE